MTTARKVPQSEAFSLYVGLAHARSYAAVARHYGVTQRAILFLAKRYRWAERLREIEAIAEERIREQGVEAVLEARERHLKSLRVLQGKALAGLRDQNARSMGEAAKALETAIKLERLILGESTANTQVSVEERSQREVDQLVVQDGEGDEEEFDSDDFDAELGARDDEEAHGGERD